MHHIQQEEYQSMVYELTVCELGVHITLPSIPDFFYTLPDNMHNISDHMYVILDHMYTVPDEIHTTGCFFNVSKLIRL